MLRFLHLLYFAAVLQGVLCSLHLESVRNIELPDDGSYSWPNNGVHKTGCKVTRTEIFYHCTKELNKSTSQIQDFSQLLKMRVDCRGAEGFQHNFTLVDGTEQYRPACSSWAYKKYDVFGGSLRPERDPTRKWLPWFSGDIVTVWKDRDGEHTAGVSAVFMFLFLKQLYVVLYCFIMFERELQARNCTADFFSCRRVQT